MPITAHAGTPDRSRAARFGGAALQIALVYTLVRVFWWLSSRPAGPDSVVYEILLKIAAWIVPCIVLLMLLGRQSPRAAVRELRLGGSPWRSLGVAGIATAPMAAALVLTPVGDLDLDLLLHSALVGPLAEEVLFRGYLCWQLVARAGWSGGWAIAVSSALFGLAHLDNLDSWLGLLLYGPGIVGAQLIGSSDAIGVSPTHVLLSLGSAVIDDALVAVPYALGGALFGWMLLRWRSLWPVVALHGAMNFWWVLAEGGNVRMAVGLTPMSVAHSCAIALAVGLTLALTRRERRALSSGQTI